jgi:hypothetical protein
MRLYTAVILFLLMSIQLASPFIVNLAWHANKDFIQKNLCINIEKPAIHCKGKCQLTKQYNKIFTGQENNNENTMKLKISFIDNFISELTSFQVKNIGEIVLEKKLLSFSNSYHFLYYQTCIKPPIETNS